MTALRIAAVFLALWLVGSATVVTALWIAAQHLDTPEVLHSVTEGNYP